MESSRLCLSFSLWSTFASLLHCCTYILAVSATVCWVLWVSKITADGDYNHEIKRRLLLRRKVMTNLDSILKSRDITLSIKVHLVKAMVFPVFMYGCESWAIRRAEHQRTDAFELWCWRRLLRVPWTARRSEGDDRGWDGWMASPSWWTWVSASSGSGWWPGRPGVL